jgi:uncharacterized protein (TIGR00251 family)
MSTPPQDKPWPCVRSSANGVVLDLSVVPGAKRTEPVGLHDGALRLRLAAPPVDGKANEALLAWLADDLQCARRDVRLLRGAAGRRKQVALEIPMARVVDWLTRRLPPG